MTDTTTRNHLSPAPTEDGTAGRAICNALYLFLICPQHRCRRAGACSGSPQTCVRRHARTVPEEVWDWVFAVLDAKEDGLTLEATMESLEPFAPAYLAWISGVIAGTEARR